MPINDTEGIAMGGRNSKPTDLLRGENKSHRTNEELEYREEMEKVLYTGVRFKERDRVKNNPVAHKEFLRLKKLYKSIPYVDALDEQIINRYCTTLAEIEPLEQLLEKMQDDVEACEKPADRIALYKAISGTLQAVNRMKTMVTAWEDRLYLNPSGRMRAIPKKPPKEGKPDPLKAAGYDI